MGGIHFHVHAHDGGVRHVHAHAHAPSVGLLHRRRALSHRHEHADRLPLRALAVGCMHGLAGSAALVLLSLEAVQSFPLGLVYILLFGAGSIVGMALLSVAIAIPLRMSGSTLRRLHRGLTAAVGSFSCGLGLLMIWQIAIQGGLLVN